MKRGFIITPTNSAQKEAENVMSILKNVGLQQSAENITLLDKLQQTCVHLNKKRLLFLYVLSCC